MTNTQKRFRIFAGPNGSGKSTMIKSVREFKNLRTNLQIDFGIYINADDIANAIQKNPMNFSTYKLKCTQGEFESFALNSGLLNGKFSVSHFRKTFKIEENKFILLSPKYREQLAQIIAAFVSNMLLEKGKKLSLETVFSHRSKIDIIKKANELGYKVYLYYVCTESAEINVYRVKKIRVLQNGHDVPEDKIRNRYHRSLDLIYEASQNCYQAFYFDNSGELKQFKPFAHFKLVQHRKEWDPIDPKYVPSWFKKYYSSKIK